MLGRLFNAFYAEAYESGTPSRSLFVLPILGISMFCFLTAVIALSKTQKVIEVDAEIVPDRTYIAKLEARGFLIERRTFIGQTVATGDVLAVVRTESGQVANVLAPHDGLVTDSDLKSEIRGPLEEGTLVAVIAHGDDLVLRIPVPPHIRGATELHTPVTYRFDTFLSAVDSEIVSFQIVLPRTGDVQYSAFAPLKEDQRALINLGKRIPAKIISRRLSLIDYLFAY